LAQAIIGIVHSIQGDSTGPIARIQVVANSVPGPKQGEPFVLAGHAASSVTVRNNAISGGTAADVLVNNGSSSNQSRNNTSPLTTGTIDHAC
jgi:hypothetical protein